MPPRTSLGKGASRKGPTRMDLFLRYLDRAPIALALWRSFESHRYAQEKLLHPILDVGCGDGFFAGLAFGGKVEAGIDLDEGEVELAKTSGSYRQVLKASATKIPFPDRSFRTVVSNCVLEHVPDIDQALREIRRVLKPGGRLLITVPSEHFDHPWTRTLLERIGLAGLGKAYIDGLNRVFKHHHVEDDRTWKARFSRAGLRLVSAEDLIPLPTFHTYEAWMLASFPSKVLKLLIGRWVVGPRGPVKALAARWLKGTLEREGQPGACGFLIARRP